MTDSDLPDYVKNNRDHWTKNNAAYTDGRAEHAWNEQEISWGVWNTPESEVNVLSDVRGKDVVELGCGTAYVSAWLKRGGARRVVGVDITPAQLESARRLNTKYALGLELVEANAEATGLPGASFDLAISEYGASIWCDPYKWIPEAARLLRPGSRRCSATWTTSSAARVGAAANARAPGCRPRFAAPLTPIAPIVPPKYLSVTGAQVKRVREAMGLTQYEFAKRLGVHPVTVAKWETGAQGIRGPAVRLMALLAEGATTANPKSAPRARAKQRSAKTRRSGKRKKG